MPRLLHPGKVPLSEMNDVNENQQPEQPEDGQPRRAIRSFVMRAGRMTEGQQRGVEKGWPLFGLSLAGGLLDLDQVFGRQAPRTLEIGFGMGHSLLEMAQAAPRSEEHTSELQSRPHLVCRLLLEKKKD